MRIHQSPPPQIVLVPVTTTNDGIAIAIDYRPAAGRCRIGVGKWCYQGSSACVHGYGLTYNAQQQLCVRCGPEVVE
jgi:hypothetical protein